LKKVGILTFHNAENYGAALQTYALMKTIQNLGHDCQVIDYRNQGVFLRNTLKNIYYLMTGQNPFKNHRGYHQFQSEYMNLTEKTYRKISAIEEDAETFDILIFGSDQIWNPDLSSGFDPIYFGQFSTRAKKITYAASLGKDAITAEERQTLNELTKKFDAIGVREETMLSLFDREVTCVVDPCMLLSGDAWRQIASTSFPDVTDILVYQLHANQRIIDTAVELAKVHQKKAQVISPYPILKNRNILNKPGRITPNEFLALYQHADRVVSDSFHGTIFSILFEKPFYTILPAEKTGRITSLLEKLDLTDRIITPNHMPADEIDYARVKPLLKREVDGSLAYLRKHLS